MSTRTGACARVVAAMAAAIACGLLAIAAAALPAHATDQPVAAMKSDAQHLAVDVNREAHVVGRRAEGEAHQLRRQWVAAKNQLSLEMHQLGQRFHRWWNRVKPS